MKRRVRNLTTRAEDKQKINSQPSQIAAGNRTSNRDSKITKAQHDVKVNTKAFNVCVEMFTKNTSSGPVYNIAKNEL